MCADAFHGLVLGGSTASDGNVATTIGSHATTVALLMAAQLCRAEPLPSSALMCTVASSVLMEFLAQLKAHPPGCASAGAIASAAEAPHAWTRPCSSLPLPLPQAAHVHPGFFAPTFGSIVILLSVKLSMGASAIVKNFPTVSASRKCTSLTTMLRSTGRCGDGTGNGPPGTTFGYGPPELLALYVRWFSSMEKPKPT
jgi:hypothetical protein